MATVQSSVAATTVESSGFTQFKNEPFVDFTRMENVRAMREALDKVHRQLGREYENVIGGHRVRTEAKTKSINPSHPEQVVGIFQKAGAEEVPVAIDAALKAYESWSRTPVKDRAELLFRVAHTLRERKFEWAAWLVYEVGKNWAEADADVAETIDFAEFYAREALRLDNAQPPIQLPGEQDDLRYIPLGVGAVIPPWNFPSAIMAGMTMAAIVTGNTVVLKPSGDAMAIAAKFFEVLEQCGVPAGVVNFVTGSGSSFGNELVKHPKTRFIAFTGSKEVGLHIHEVAAKAQPGQIWIKRTILEMGGKDAIVVDADSDLDDAVSGVMASAFGFSGQKCSACSRAIVDERVYDKFVERLKDRAEKLTVGPAEENPNLGPVVNEAARNSILNFVKLAVSEGGRVITGGRAVEGKDGYFIEPTVISEVKPGDTLEQQEVFGPVLAVIRCKDFTDGLRIANDTEFGLTGSVYTSSEERIAQAKQEFHVGNLYINRKCTGAMVGAHPFGGFNMSGTDSKAGGPDYLLLFTQAKSIARKL
ncbi:MAG TPA: L-glutamate gamma-semialdehyde dehydrogenase [Candidatus Saccharimonadales bacterium]|nr:L-glutamate gamma-semialdehyde dehydrogenase [Candidatus Saccharimonadales bacterium]